MNELITVNNVRGYVENGTAYVNLEDVARGLGFTETVWNNTLKEDVVKIHTRNIKKHLISVGFLNDTENLSISEQFIPENVFYKLCMKANNEVARKFQDLVCDEILPSIRKHGMYANEITIDNMINNPDFAINLLVKLKEERAEKAKLELDNQRKDETITTAVNSLMGIEKETDRKNLNTLVKSLCSEYCKIHNINSSSSISDVYMTIYRDFCKCQGISFIELQKSRIKYKKTDPTVALSSKKSYIEVIEDMGLATKLLEYIRNVKVKNIL